MNSKTKLRARLHSLLNPSDNRDRLSHAVNLFIIALILVNVLAASMATMADIYSTYRHLFHSIEMFSVGFFTIEYAFRYWSSIEDEKHLSRTNFLFSFDSMVDLLAIAPFYLALLFGLDLRALIALRLLRLLKLIRYFQPLAILGAVMKAEIRAFMAAMFILLILVFIAATGIYVFEHDAQPEVFGSIPESMWWAIVTLTTLGYGDVIPVTVPGRIFASLITILSIGTVALPAGMLASRFSEELRKRTNELDVSIAKLVVDGQLLDEDRTKLEAIRSELCLSQDDMEQLVAQQLDTNGVCPLCGKGNEH